MYDLDLLIENGTILTMNPRNDIITKGSIAVKNGIIVDIVVNCPKEFKSRASQAF